MASREGETGGVIASSNGVEYFYGSGAGQVDLGTNYGTCGLFGVAHFALDGMGWDGTLECYLD
jgi:hypothetical protein